jgi:hypothetical protein
MEAVHEQIRAAAGAAGHPELAALPGHGERLECLVARLPSAVWHKVSQAVRTRYHSLEARYGRATAITILAAGIVGSAAPVPGSSVVAMAPLIGLAELHHRLAPRLKPTGAALAAKVELAEAEVLQLGKQWVHDLAGLLNPA